MWLVRLGLRGAMETWRVILIYIIFIAMGGGGGGGAPKGHEFLPRVKIRVFNSLTQEGDLY